MMTQKSALSAGTGDTLLQKHLWFRCYQCSSFPELPRNNINADTFLTVIFLRVICNVHLRSPTAEPKDRTKLSTPSDPSPAERVPYT